MTGMSPTTRTLFQPLRAGELLLPNRVVMAPMTRNRATIDGTPTDLMARYYAQRATAGLIITEATTPTTEGTAAPLMPGLYTDAHERGWRHVTEAVHAAGGRIVVQLCHGGRATHSSLIGDLTPLAPSPIAAQAEVFTAAGPMPASEPRELTDHELAAVPGWFADAAQRALRAGADGIELHAGNGFLLNQFLDPVANQRSDLYGHDRTRLLADVVDAVGNAIGRGRVGVRVSPGSGYNDMRDDAPAATLAAVAEHTAARHRVPARDRRPAIADSDSRVLVGHAADQRAQHHPRRRHADDAGRGRHGRRSHVRSGVPRKSRPPAPSPSAASAQRPRSRDVLRRRPQRIPRLPAIRRRRRGLTVPGRQSLRPRVEPQSRGWHSPAQSADRRSSSRRPPVPMPRTLGRTGRDCATLRSAYPAPGDGRVRRPRRP